MPARQSHSLPYRDREATPTAIPPPDHRRGIQSPVHLVQRPAESHADPIELKSYSPDRGGRGQRRRVSVPGTRRCPISPDGYSHCRVIREYLNGGRSRVIGIGVANSRFRLSHRGAVDPAKYSDWKPSHRRGLPADKSPPIAAPRAIPSAHLLTSAPRYQRAAEIVRFPVL